MGGGHALLQHATQLAQSWLTALAVGIPGGWVRGYLQRHAAQARGRGCQQGCCHADGGGLVADVPRRAPRPASQGFGHAHAGGAPQAADVPIRAGLGVAAAAAVAAGFGGRAVAAAVRKGRRRILGRVRVLLRIRQRLARPPGVCLLHARRAAAVEHDLGAGHLQAAAAVAQLGKVDVHLGGGGAQAQLVQPAGRRGEEGRLMGGGPLKAGRLPGRHERADGARDGEPARSARWPAPPVALHQAGHVHAAGLAAISLVPLLVQAQHAQAGRQRAALKSAPARQRQVAQRRQARQAGRQAEARLGSAHPGRLQVQHLRARWGSRRVAEPGNGQGWLQARGARRSCARQRTPAAHLQAAPPRKAPGVLGGEGVPGGAQHAVQRPGWAAQHRVVCAGTPLRLSGGLPHAHAARVLPGLLLGCSRRQGKRRRAADEASLPHPHRRAAQPCQASAAGGPDLQRRQRHALARRCEGLGQGRQRPAPCSSPRERARARRARRSPLPLAPAPHPPYRGSSSAAQTTARQPCAAAWQALRRPHCRGRRLRLRGPQRRRPRRHHPA